MPGIWDLYLDSDDAKIVLAAAAALERHAAIREPLPLNDAQRLCLRLQMIAPIAAEEATYWSYEAEDRRVEAEGDGGRWGTAATAHQMHEIAQQRAAGSQQVAELARAAADDLTRRLADRVGSLDHVVSEHAAERAVHAQARDLLDFTDHDG